MVLRSINQLKLMIYDQIKIIKSNFKDITYKYDKPNIQSCINSASIYVLMLIGKVICTIYLFHTMMNHLSIQKQTLMYLFTTIIIQFDCFMHIYTFYIDDFRLQLTFTSHIRIFNELSSMFVNCIVVGFNSSDCKSYYTSFIASILIYLSIT